MEKPIEVWEPIKGFEGIYEISSYGRVKSLERFNYRGYKLKEKILNPKSKNREYKIVALRKNNKYHHVSIHRLVAMAFIPNCDNLPQVNHINGNKHDNYSWNLEWVSQHDNITHAINTGLTQRNGEKNGNAKLKEQQVREIRKTYAMGNVTQEALGKKFNVPASRISYIVNRKSWKSI